MDFGIIYKDQFNHMPLSAAQMEAHKVGKYKKVQEFILFI
jgi:hypothetical protein